MSVLDVRDLTIRYRTRAGPLTAARDVSFQVGAGQALGLVGESGSGKSTIAAAILSLLDPGAQLEGSILFNGVDLCTLRPDQKRGLLGRQIGAVFQDPFTALNPAIHVGRQIAEPLEQHLGMSPRAAFERACELLADMGISRAREVASAYPHQLSGGMKQRALIAAAIACEPPLLIFDEPTTALDVTVEAQILALIADLRRRKAISLIFISHNLGVVREVCDDLVVMYASQVVEHGAVGDVLRAPKHPYTKGLLASLPRLVATTRESRLPSIPGRMTNTAKLTGCLFRQRCPFAEERCAAPQAMVAVGEAREARCWKAADLGDWPVTVAPAAAAASPHGGELMDVADLRKTFHTSRGLAAVRIDLSGQGCLIRYEPKQLAAVDGVSLSIKPGEVLGLVGESGCGKSTLGRLVLRLLRATSGEVRFEGRDVLAMPDKDLRPFRRSAQIIFQNADSSLNPRLSVGGALERPLVLFNLVAPRERGKRVDALLDMVRLPRSYRGRYAHQLSGGEKQRVAIARALATDPKFIVCDEPVSSLDVSVQAAIVNLMADLRDAFGLAYLLISHDLAVVSQLSDRIAVMYRGGICEIGTAAEVLAAPYHPYTEMLLTSLPSVDGEPSRERKVAPAINLESEPTTGCRFQARCPYKIGAICETVAPPLRALSQTHAIACHLETTQVIAATAMNSLSPQAGRG